tara:strand:+ start:546 stop:929 length:384 start_codon:yes stop_codon:yes gene_type:complete
MPDQTEITTQDVSEKLRGDLRMFDGTAQWYRHPFNSNLLYTDGTKFFAEKAGAYWFLDIVATELADLMETEEFMVIALNVKGMSATITAGDGNGNDLWQRDIDFTDAPDGVWKFFFANNVLYLPSEH